MTPKEKAEELVTRFIRYTPADEELEYPYAKQCAIIAVENELESVLILFNLCPFANYMKEILSDKIDELKLIKSEIEEL